MKCSSRLDGLRGELRRELLPGSHGMRFQTERPTGMSVSLRAEGARRCADDGVARFFVLRVRGSDAREFLLHDGGEFRHLFFHFDHFFAHVQDDFDASEVYAHVAREREDYVQALEIGIGVEARVTLGTRGLEQSDALIKA
jgi:hypothetical protein